MKSIKIIFMVAISVFVMCLNTNNVSALSANMLSATGNFNSIPEEKQMAEGIFRRKVTFYIVTYKFLRFIKTII